MTVNMGPQHPSTHGVFRLVLEIDGEVVVSAKPTIGYLHTGIEKTAEQKKWQQVIPLMERMDYLGAQSNSFAYALSVEKLLGLEMPDRVKWIRILLVELQRINSHLVWLGTHAMDLGAVSVMLYCFRERELILNINEMIAGFRMFPSYIRVGGLREDLPRGFHEAVQFAARAAAREDQDYEDLLTKNTIFLNRTQGVGTFTLEQCYGYGLSARWPARRDRLTTCGRRSRTRATTPSSSTSPRETATCTTATWCASRRCGRASASAGRRSSGSRRPASTRWTIRAWCRRRRTRSTPRWKRSSSTS